MPIHSAVHIDFELLIKFCFLKSLSGLKIYDIKCVRNRNIKTSSPNLDQSHIVTLRFC